MNKLVDAIHNNSNRSNRSCNARLVALVVAATMTVASTHAMAAVTCFTTPIAVPVTTAGIYVNLFTGAAGATAATAGWDFNPWGSGGSFFYIATTTPVGGFVSAAGLIANLSTGTLVDGSSSYLGNGNATTMATYRAGVTNGNLGVRFIEGGSTYYAWVNVTTTAPTGLPVTINRWCFENTPGTGITVGTTPVMLQKYSVE